MGQFEQRRFRILCSSLAQILQEVAAARALSVMYKCEEMSGFTFVRGLENLASAMSTQTAKASIPAIIRLMAYTPPSTYSSTQRLDIASLGEITEMFYAQDASDQRDKVYAILGMRSDSNSRHSIQPDYEKPWKNVFRDLIENILGDRVISYIGGPGDADEHAVITANGCPVGVVESVTENEIVVKSRKYNLPNRPGEWGWSAKWGIHQYTKAIREGDMICVFEGAQFPTIIRPCRDHFDIVVIVLGSVPDVMLNKGNNSALAVGHMSAPRDEPNWSFPACIVTDFQPMLLVWDWTDLGPSNTTRKFSVKSEKTRRKDEINFHPINYLTHLFISPTFELIRRWNFDSDMSQVPGSDIMTSRHRSIIQVLDDMWLHGSINSQLSEILHHHHCSIELVGNEELAKLQYCSNLASYEWLKRHASLVRRCIKLLHYPPKQENMPANPVSLDHWTNTDNRDYSILELYAIADRHDILSHLKDEPVIGVSKNYWTLGEQEHQNVLLGFSSYAAALTDLNPWSIGKSLPLNGRYVMNLLLAEESRGTIGIEAWVKHVCERPFPSPNMNITILALLSESCNNRLPIEPQLIESIPLTNSGQIIIIFLYTELHWKKEVLRHILARVLAIRHTPDDRFLHDFLLVYGNRIADHIGRLIRRKSTRSPVVEDFMVEVISEHMLSSDDAASYCQSGPNLSDLLEWFEELLDVTHVYGMSQGSDEGEPELEVLHYIPADEMESSATAAIGGSENRT
jgi:hypothetical protein